MSFFSSSPYKPHIRQEGFSPANLAVNDTDNNNSSPVPSPNQGGFNDLFSLPAHTFLGDNQPTATSRKYPSSMDFSDELASLIADRSPNNPHAQPSSSNSSSNQYEDHHRYGAGTTHNIFDVSAVPHPSSVSSTTTGGLGSQPSSLHSDYHHHTQVFNSTLPALNSSMRYEPLPPPSHQQGSPSMNNNPPPSAYHTFSVGNNRHTPSPIHGVHSPIMNSHHNDARSRSRSRPPASSAGGPSSLSNADSKNPTSPTLANAQNVSSIGPARTTRARRNNSVSSTSPPPYGSMHGRPHAIVIPGSARAQQQQQQGWFVSSQSSASEYSLPTPGDSHPLPHLNGSSPNGNGNNNFNSFSLSPPSDSHGGNMHLPPVSSLHSPIHTGSYHGHSHSLSMGSHRDFGMNSMHGHSQSMSIPKSPGHGPVLDYVLPPYNPNGTNATGNVNGGNSLSYGMTPPGVSVMNMNLGGGVGSPVLSSSVGVTSSVGIPGTGSGRGGGGMNSGALSSSVPSSGGTAVNGSSSTSTTAVSTSTTPGVGGAAPNGTLDKQSLIANEKRRRRRESHNAVERRRRDNINEKISELATLIPECMLDGTSATANGTSGGSPSAMAASPGLLDTTDPLLPMSPAEKKEAGIKEEGGSATGEEGGVVKANKGMILRKSVEYIRYLQQLVTAQGARNRELEQELKAYRGGSSGAPSETGEKIGGTDTDSPLDKDQQHSYGMSQSHYGHHQLQDDQEMMLHDSVGDYGSMHVGGMLPSMPEGEDEDEERDDDGGGMDVDNDDKTGRERGRTRVARRTTNGGGFHHVAPKEEIQDEDGGLASFSSLAMVGMQA